jgi:hypothetical protein
MAAFTHLNPAGNRFSDGTYGVFYAARDLDTAIAETTYHRERFMRATGESRMELDMRVYLVDLVAALHDLRGRKAEYPLVYHSDNYAAGQHLAATLRKEGSNGIAYDSVGQVRSLLDKRVGDAVTVAAVAGVVRAAKSPSSSSRIAFS